MKEQPEHSSDSEQNPSLEYCREEFKRMVAEELTNYFHGK